MGKSRKKIKSPELIKIDNREPKGSQKLGLLVLKGAIVVRLLIGDVNYKHLYIERKEIFDLISSMKDTRLNNQCINMMEQSDLSFVIIIGDYEDVKKDGRYPDFTRDMYEGLIASLNINYKMHTINVKSECRFWTMVKHLIIEYDKDKVVTRKLKPGEKRITIEEAMLSRIPRLGMDRTRKILKKFEFPMGLINATEKDLMEIDGVGKVLAKSIKSVFKDGKEEV